LILVPLTRVGCTAISPLHNKLVEFTVLIFVHDTKVGCTATFQLPNNEVEFTVLILVQLTNLSCLLSIASFRAFHCAALRASVVELESKLLTTLGKAHQSLRIFQVFQSNKATWLLVELAGPITSQLQVPSAQSSISKS
jgi:hypothetical protein